MSLYTHEEVCVGCIYAEFHECCGKFCRCILDETIDTIRGTCEMKKTEGD